LYRLTDSNRKILKAILVISILPSMYFGLQAMFIDLYNPGSAEARELAGRVDSLFWITFIVALPLLYEKIRFADKWFDSFNAMSFSDKMKVVIPNAKKVFVQFLIVLFLAVVSAIIIQYYLNIPPEVIQNYQDYYNSKNTFNIYELNNITIVNNLTVNHT
jgi:hypothetical protein